MRQYAAIDIGSGKLADGASPECGQQFAAHYSRAGHLRRGLPVNAIIPQELDGERGHRDAIGLRRRGRQAIENGGRQRLPRRHPRLGRGRDIGPPEGHPRPPPAPVDHDEPRADPAGFAHPQTEAGKLGIDEDAVSNSRRESSSGEVAIEPHDAGRRIAESQRGSR